MSYIKKAKVGKVRRAIKTVNFWREGIPRIINKAVNSVTRRAVNEAEKRGLPPKTAAQMRVAIEMQAAKDGNQSWRSPKENKHITSSGVVKPSDLENRHLERLAKIELKQKIQENSEILDISSFQKKPKGKIYQLFPKLESFVRSLKEDALPTSAREVRTAARHGYDAALKKQKEELAIELSSGDRNPWIGKYADARKNIVSKARIVLLTSAGWNQDSIKDMLNQGKEKIVDYADTSMKDAKNTMSNINQFATDLPKKIQELQKIPQRASKKSSEAKQYIENKVKESFNRTNQPIKISMQHLKNLYDKKASRNGNAMLKRGLKKMHTPMKSVSVPYTRTLTDDSVPSPKKFMHKMMGGKTGRMGKELTGADGVKGRYFQKGQRMIKFYEVDKPHAPQMRSMGMGMGKIQKAKIVTRMRIPSEGVLRGAMVDAMRGTSGKLRTTIKPSKYKSEVLNAFFDAMPETSGILRTTIKPKKSTRMTVASKPPKGYLSAYTKDRLKRAGELEDIRTAMAGTPTGRLLSVPQYKGFRNFSEWKSQNETPRDLNRILTNAVRNKGIVSRTKISAGDYNTPIVFPMMKKRATRKMHEITDENYYGNQKPRKKDEFLKNQGAFINGRKLKY